MKKIIVFSIAMFIASFASFGQSSKSSTFNLDKAEALSLSKLKADYPSQLKKAPNDYEFSLDKKEGYIETFLMNVNGKKYEVYLFKDKKSLMSFIQRLIGGGTVPGTWDSKSVCDCAGGIQCSCPKSSSSPSHLFAIP